MFKPTKFTSSGNYPINLNSDEFSKTISKILEEHKDIEEIIETGTFNGLGSTMVFAKTTKYVFSIECNRDNYNAAIKNLSGFQNVCVVNGLSMDRKMLIDFLLNEQFDVDTTYDSAYPKAFYMREISHQVVLDDALGVFCNNPRKQLVFLDSAGGVGFAEFNYFMTFPDYEKKVLVLDDIDHIKHKRSVERLEEMGYKVYISDNKRFAWTDFSKK